MISYIVVRPTIHPSESNWEATWSECERRLAALIPLAGAVQRSKNKRPSIELIMWQMILGRISNGVFLICDCYCGASYK